MPTATVTVQGKSDPEMGKKRGRIKSDTGMIFQAAPEILEKVKVGSSYRVSYKDETFGEAKYRVIEAVHPYMGEPKPTEAINTRSSGGRIQVPAAPVEDRRGEDIATLAIVKEWIGRIPVGDTAAVVHALKSARAAWLKFKAGGDDRIESGIPIRDEMADEIPEFPGDR